MTALRSWIFGIVGTAIISGVALSLTPKGKVRDVTRLLCGVVMVIALIKPALDFDFDAFSANMAKNRMSMYELDRSLEEENDRLARVIIEQECGAYILDKAGVFDMGGVTADVTAKRGDDGYWYPYEVSVELPYRGAGEERLSRTIEADLGIPPERQNFLYG